MKELYATLDLGSNSFHMLTAAFEYGEVKVLDSISEKVMLAEGLTKFNGITPEAQQRGIECITRFSQRMGSIPHRNIRIVGTNTLRAACNAQAFLEKIQAILGNITIDVISGVEEARLIFLGVNHSWSSHDLNSKHLVIDIGGGSTEFIIGKSFQQENADSLRMGCVSYRRFFENGEINVSNFDKAVRTAELKIADIQQEYTSLYWDHVIGSAGTFKALEKLSKALGFSDEGVRLQDLEKVKTVLLSFPNIDALELSGLKRLRNKTILPGLAIAIAIFKQLKIKEMHIARGGLREGILYELVGESGTEDIKKRSIKALCNRHQVSETVQHFYIGVKNNLLSRTAPALIDKLTDVDLKILTWAVSVAKIGLSINHSQYQKHSAYLIKNSELNGFSLSQRERLSHIVMNHRRKLNLELFSNAETNDERLKSILTVILLCRLTYIFGQNGKDNGYDGIRLFFDKGFVLECSKTWIQSNLLIDYALAKESELWDTLAISFQVRKTDVTKREWVKQD